MKNLVPRLIGEPEAKRLGIPGGWYGTRVSGTLMTESCISLDACVEAIDLIPEPVEIADPHAGRHALEIAAKARSIHAITNAQARTAYQIARRPRPLQ